MNRGQSVFAQLLGFVPFSHFEHLVDQFASNHGIRHFSAWNHFLCIAHSQLTRREVDKSTGFGHIARRSAAQP